MGNQAGRRITKTILRNAKFQAHHQIEPAQRRARTGLIIVGSVTSVKNLYSQVAVPMVAIQSLSMFPHSVQTVPFVPYRRDVVVLCFSSAFPKW